jgi:hypothetical protein
MLNRLTHTPVPLNTYEVMGHKVRIHFNEQTVTRMGEDGVEVASYTYSTACVDKVVGRDAVIEAIIATQYPTYGSELAAIQNGGDAAQEHADLRILAKSLATGWLQ